MARVLRASSSLVLYKSLDLSFDVHFLSCLLIGQDADVLLRNFPVRRDQVCDRKTNVHVLSDDAIVADQHGILDTEFRHMLFDISSGAGLHVNAATLDVGSV